MKTQSFNREQDGPGTMQNVGSVRKSYFQVRMLAAILGLVVLLPALGFAKGNLPFFAAKGTASDSDTYNYKFQFVNTAGKTETIEFAVVSLGKISDSFLVKTIQERLNGTAEVKGEYQFSVFESLEGWWYVFGQPQKGMTPKPVKDSVKITKGDATLITTAGIDPADGYATFDFTGSPSGGEVVLGVNGFFVDTPTTYSNGSPKTTSQIKLDLVDALLQLGFSNVGIDSTSGELYVSGVSSGDPTTDDTGATILSTDPGVGASGSMALGAAESPRPRRGTVTASPRSGPVGTTVTVSISGFPGSSTINIDFAGAQVTTITTRADGTGTGTFVVPAGTAAIDQQITASGGTPVTFGYGWFRVTQPQPQR